MSNRLALCLVLFSLSTAFAADAPTAGKTGDFTVNFTQRSPLTNLKELSTRFAQKNLSPDYDLSSQQFLVHVPANYDPDKPMGLIVLINYKSTPLLPRPVLPIFDERNLAFISESDVSPEWWVKCGQAIDAAYNMQQLYKIDPTRIYIFSFTNQQDCGVRLATCYPDVFSGTFLSQEDDIWKPVPAGNGKFYTPTIPHPPAKQLAVARRHPMVLATLDDKNYPELAQGGRQVEKVLKGDGFRYFKLIQYTIADFHYPNYTTPWLIDTLTFLDANAPKPPATKPTTQPQ
jgi:hypothetical protein